MSQPHDPSQPPPSGSGSNEAGSGFSSHEAGDWQDGPTSGYPSGDMEDTVIMPNPFLRRSAPSAPEPPHPSDVERRPNPYAEPQPPADDNATILSSHPFSAPSAPDADGTVLAAPGAGNYVHPQGSGWVPDTGATVLSQPTGGDQPPQPTSASEPPSGEPYGAQSAAEQERPIGRGPVGAHFAPQQPEAASESEGPADPPSSTTTQSAQRKRPPVWVLVLIGLVVVGLIVALVAFWLGRPSGQDSTQPTTSASATPTPTPSKPLPPAPPAILAKDARQITLPDKVDPWFPKKVQSDPTPTNVRRGQYQTADGAKTLYLDVYVDSSMTVDKRSKDFAPDTIKDSAHYRCGRLKSNQQPLCIADVKDGMVEARGSIKDIQDKTIDDALQTWMKGNQ